MNSITSRQINVDLFSNEKGLYFQHGGKDHALPNMDKVHEFFQRQPFDTVKLSQDGKQESLSKKALRKTLSQENGGAWIEEKEGKKRYFVDDSGWFQTSFKQVSKKEYLQKLESPSIIQKVLGIGLGLLALSPGMVEFARHIPKEMGMGLLAFQQKSPLLGALGLSLLPSSAEAQAMGTEFQVNNYTTSLQSNPSVAALNDGGFVVTWMSEGQDGNSGGIFAQKYSASGAFVGSEFQVNNYTAHDQRYPSIAALNNGGFVISWYSFGQDGDLDGIFAQKYGTSGTLSGLEFRVNNFTASYQRLSSVAALNDGGFVISWQSNGQDGNSYGIFAQRYDENGAIVGSEFQVNTYTENAQSYPEVASLNDGGFVITWQSSGQDGDGPGIFAQRYNESGALFGTEFQVNNFTTSLQLSPSITSLIDGGFIVAWESNGQDGSSWGIFAQRYEANGNLFGSEFQVNNYTTNGQSNPVIAPLNDGGFVVAWQSEGQDGDGFGIFAQRYDSSGSLLGLEFQVSNYTTGDQQLPSVAPLNDGGFVVVWQSDGQDGDLNGIFGQRYDRSGSPVSLTYVPPMNSTSALGSNVDNSNLPSNQLTSALSSNSGSILTSRETSQITQLATTLLSPISLPSSPNEDESLSSSFSLSASSTNGMQTRSSTPSELEVPVLIDVIYGQNYTVTQNGQIIGTFTITGGSGPYSSNNPNILEIEFDPNFELQDGDTFTIFSVPIGENVLWEGISLTGSECFYADGELVLNTDTNQNDYQVIFNVDEDQCSIYSDASKFSAIPVLAGGGLI